MGQMLKSEFVRNIFTLVSATFIAQLISYTITPILTRLYSPEDFGELALFMRIIGMGTAIATLRYEQAVPIVKLDWHALRLVGIVLKLILFVGLVMVVFGSIWLFLSQDSAKNLGYMLVPFGVILLAYYTLGSSWLLRFKLVRQLGIVHITNTIVSNVLKIIGFQFGYLGLILGTVAGYILACIPISKVLLKDKTSLKVNLWSKRNYAVAKEFSDFPKINFPHGLTDYGRDMLVAVLFISLFSKAEYGLYDHAFKMLRLPLILIGAAIGQLFLQKCAASINEGNDPTKFVYKTLKTLALMCIVPFGVLFIWGEDLFAFVFGKEWAPSGHYSQIMAIWLASNFVLSPITALPTVLRRQGSFFVLSVLMSITLILSIVIPQYVFEATLTQTLWVISLGQAVFSAISLQQILGYLKDYKRDNL